MIDSFKDKKLKRFYDGNDRSKIAPDMADKIAIILQSLDASLIVSDMDLPGYKLHRLKGNLKGFYSVWVTGNYRIIFRFENGKAFDVELIDYH